MRLIAGAGCSSLQNKTSELLLSRARPYGKPLDQNGKQKGPDDRGNAFADTGLTQEQMKKLQAFQNWMQAEVKKANATRDRETTQAVQKKFLAGLAKILDEEQIKKHKAAVAKIREYRQAAIRDGKAGH